MIRFFNARLTGAVVAMVAGAVFSAIASADIVIYQDSFSRGTVGTPIALDGTPPDVVNAPSALWSASTSGAGLPNFTDGDHVHVGASATGFLPFLPVTGNVYVLSADLNTTATDNNWAAIGFSVGNSIGGMFSAGGVGPWVLQVGDGTSADATFLGPVTQGQVNGSASGTQGISNYSIVLDTTTAFWTVTYYRGVTVLSGPRTFSATDPNPTINYVMFGNSGGTTSDTDNFILTQLEVPEPASLTLLGIALPLVLRRRR